MQRMWWQVVTADRSRTFQELSSSLGKPRKNAVAFRAAFQWRSWFSSSNVKWKTTKRAGWEWRRGGLMPRQQRLSPSPSGCPPSTSESPSLSFDSGWRRGARFAQCAARSLISVPSRCVPSIRWRHPQSIRHDSLRVTFCQFSLDQKEKAAGEICPRQYDRKLSQRHVILSWRLLPTADQDCWDWKTPTTQKGVRNSRKRAMGDMAIM